ncbi:DUF1801 domain-containing protein [Brevibacillus ruminantium]|uniref:DUF1801 domain-containing protein n=1 Tax=Brevibacillus ruminantium TaxID=2950604 RepID=A0ABY4WBT1_9BACL|nr:DUF1801 domain-containing protein [Brevibacillus ruminantium]USG64359.1 DUF1801 domain-containing protein [Brevibacillus ruminantium]
MSYSKKKNETTDKKTKKLSGPEQVEAYFDSLEHPQKMEIEEVRNIILESNDEITEHIKWNAPSFCYQDEDRITFNLRGKEYFMLVFHCGAKVKNNEGKDPIFEDTTGLLNWVSRDRATVTFTDRNDVIAKKEKLAEVVKKWIEVTRSYESTIE